MSDLFAGLLSGLDFFHFLRPWWLALIPAALILWWRIRSRATVRPHPPAGIAPHLAAALTVGGGGASRILAIDGVIATVFLISLGAAGPTWSRVPNPLVAQWPRLGVGTRRHRSVCAGSISGKSALRRRWRTGSRSPCAGRRLHSSHRSTGA